LRSNNDNDDNDDNDNDNIHHVSENGSVIVLSGLRTRAQQ
jgi:hypothetical protein